MSADRKFTHRGVTVLIWSKSIKITGMHDNIYLGAAPDDDQIKRMIDAIQQAGHRADVEVKTHYRCPICTQGQLVEVGFETWQCSRPRCNSEFFYDGEPGQRMLNCRDKPYPRWRIVFPAEERDPSLRERFLRWWYGL
ncbi:hypothetical protein [Sphingomonas phage Carli]|nr:hypothetical protein [Sphingomonas phage Carli]